MSDVGHERYLEMSARIAGVEFLVKRLIWILIVPEGGDEKDAIAETVAFREESKEALQHAAFPSLGPASSDHVAAMAAESVDRVLGELIEEMEAEYGIRKE